MAVIYVDNRPHQVADGQNLLSACLSLGYDLPFFCWHPALGSVGACRQCAVKLFRDEKDRHGRIVMACMTPASDGARISIDDPEAVGFRAAVIEWLMANHPHDCPVCDEGGECHLQDMTVMTGHVRREFRFAKRTHENQDLGPFVNHEMNRCIACYRCVRFYHDYAGGRDLDVFGAHDHVYFGRAKDGVLESEFAGNLVEMCPTGVFTDKVQKGLSARKWDLSTAPSVCALCGMGCNTLPGERYGKLTRVRNRYHHEINGYFLCDLGRFGHGFVNSEARIRRIMVKAGTRGREQASPEAALARAAQWAARGNLVGIGSPRASLEANFALRALVGPDRFFAGISSPDLAVIRVILDTLRRGPARTPAPREAQEADAVLVLGEDVSNTGPILALHLRHMRRPAVLARAKKAGITEWNAAGMQDAAQGEKGRLFLAAPFPTRLDPWALALHRSAPRDLARLGFAVAARLTPGAPEVAGLSDAGQAFAEAVARALSEAERPLVISGAGCRSTGVIRAAARVAWALCSQGRPAGLFLVAPEANSLGLALLSPAGGLEDALALLKQDNAGGVAVLENDLFRRLDAKAAEKILGAAPLLALDHFETETTKRADVLLPAATFAESTGTFISSEGRAQRFFQVMAPEGDVQPSWRWLADLSKVLGQGPKAEWQNIDDLLLSLSRDMPELAGAALAAPNAAFRLTGGKVPRQSHRFSGRTAIHAHISVSEPRPPDDPDSPLAFSMEGHDGPAPAALIARYWAPGWNSVQALNRFQDEVGGPLRGGDPGVRLISPGNESPLADPPEPADGPTDGRLLLVPMRHLFGSAGVSDKVPAIAARAPEPALFLGPGDAEALRVSENEIVKVSVGGQHLLLAVIVVFGMPEKVAGIVTGLAGQPFLDLPAPAAIAKDDRDA